MIKSKDVISELPEEKFVDETEGKGNGVVVPDDMTPEKAEAIRQFQEAMKCAIGNPEDNDGKSIKTTVDVQSMLANTSVAQVKQATQKQRKKGRKVYLEVQTDEGPKTIMLSRKMLQTFFHGALCECIEQCFNAFEAMKERYERGVSPAKIVQAVALILASNIEKAIAALSGERDLSTQQRHALAFLKEGQEKFAALNGASAEDTDVQVSVVHLVSHFMFAFHHVMHPATHPHKRLKVIDAYRNGKSKIYMEPVKNAGNPVVALHNQLFADKPVTPDSLLESLVRQQNEENKKKEAN